MPTDYTNDVDVKKLREKMASVINDSDKDLERIKTAEMQDLAAPEDLLTRTISNMADDIRDKSFPKEAAAMKEARGKKPEFLQHGEKKDKEEAGEEKTEEKKEASAEEPAAEPTEPSENPFYTPFDFKAAFENPAFAKGFNDFIEQHAPIWKEAALNVMFVPVS